MQINKNKTMATIIAILLIKPIEKEIYIRKKIAIAR